jgi:hypothetical protein
MSTFAFEQDGETRRTSRSFYRGANTNFHPTDASLDTPNFVDEYVMKGWNPPEKFVTKATPIVAFGSCFATNISNYLHNRGYNVLTKRDNKAYVTQMGDGMVNTFAILQQFEWAWLNKHPSVDIWQGKKGEEYGYDETIRLETRELFDQAELFIITLGLSELWYDEPTGEVFWRAVPADAYDPARHKFRTASHAETLANLRSIYGLIQRFRPNAKVLFSVSPIPLTATFRAVSCLTADAVSKATLRSALDEFLLTHQDEGKLFYFPSYEAVTRIYRNQWADDRRHVRPDVLTFNMKMFEHYFCSPGIAGSEMMDAYNHAREVDLLKGETMRNRDAISYAEQRAIKKEAKINKRIEAKINARLEARRLGREEILAERARLKKLEKTITTEDKRKNNLKTIGLRAIQAVVGVAVLDSVVDWATFALASF